jgi:hypothetical protein
MSETGQAPKLFFTPVHPLNVPLRTLLAEERQPSLHWSNVERVCQLYEDVEGLLRARVCFSDPTDPGNIDNVRCYNYVIGRRSVVGDPYASIGSLKDAADECERQMLRILAALHGEPQAA